MAPTEDVPGPGELAKYLDERIPDIITKYDKLWDAQDPEENPYTSKLEARAILEAAVKDLEGFLAGAPEGEETNRGLEMVARFFLFLGKNYYHCEEVSSSEVFFNRSLERYLKLPTRTEAEVFCHIQDAFNQLGMLWCHRQAHSEGMNFLRRAEIMFKNRPASVRESSQSYRCENNYTLTMFYLAMAYGGLLKPGLSARFCAECMSQQLEHNTAGNRSKEADERDPFDCKDWVRNCCSLSDFFVNECMFWTAEYLLHAAAVMCEKCEEVCGLRPDGLAELYAECLRDLGVFYATRLKFARTCNEHPALGEQVWRGERKPPPVPKENAEGSRLTFRCAADTRRGDRPPEGGPAPVAWDEVFPEVVHLEDEEAQDNRLAEESDATAADDSDGVVRPNAGGWLELRPGERVRLPVHFRRLHDATQRRICRANAHFFELRGPLPAPAVDPGAELADSTPADPSAASDPDAGKSDDPEGSAKPSRQPSCLGTTFETARQIFRLANHYLGKALEHFLLDGWVTEHVRILQEISQLYRSLQFWEADYKRSAAMMTRRARMLTPLLGVLNPKVYVAFWRQLAFECAEVFQELYELKAHRKFPWHGSKSLAVDDDDDDDDEIQGAEAIRRAARCNELARKSALYYGTFVDSYHTDGQAPDRIDDDNVRSYLTARLNRARLRTKTRGLGADEQIEAYRLSLREYEWIIDYNRRHPEVSTKPAINMGKEIRLCEEMAEMLPSKLSQLAARRRR